MVDLQAALQQVFARYSRDAPEQQMVEQFVQEYEYPSDITVLDFIEIASSVGPETELYRVPPALSWLDTKFVLIAFSVVDILDACTDVAMPAQIIACEFEFPEMVDLYDNSWASFGLAHQVISRSHLSGVTFARVGVAILCQMTAACCDLWKTRTVAESIQRFADAHRNGEGFEAMTQAADDLSLKYSSISEVSDAVGMMHLAKFFQNAAGDLMLECRDHDPVQQAAEKYKRASIAFTAIFKKVLLEAVPSVYAAIAFFSVSFGQVDSVTRVKIVATIAFSVATILQKAVKCFGLGMFANTVGAVLVLLAVALCIKLVMTCHCASHVFILSRMTCFQP